MTEATDTWAEWLRRKLAGRPNTYLVRRSGTKPNGRPRIDDSRVSKWLSGQQRPTVDLVVATAEALGEDQVEALTAAGYGPGAVRLYERYGAHPAASALGTRYMDLSDRLEMARNELRALEQHQIDVHRDVEGKRAEVDLLASMVLREMGALDQITRKGGDGDADDATGGSAPTSSDYELAADHDDVTIEEEQERDSDLP